MLIELFLFLFVIILIVFLLLFLSPELFLDLIDFFIKSFKNLISSFFKNITDFLLCFINFRQNSGMILMNFLNVLGAVSNELSILGVDFFLPLNQFALLFVMDVNAHKKVLILSFLLYNF